MRTLIFVLGIAVMLECAAIIIKPQFYRTMLGLFRKGRLVYLPAAAKVAFGILFLVSATNCNRPWIIIALGILTCASGVSVYFMKLAKTHALLNWLYEKPSFVIRLLGIAGLLIGAVITYAAGMPR